MNEYVEQSITNIYFFQDEVMDKTIIEKLRQIVHIKQYFGWESTHPKSISKKWLQIGAQSLWFLSFQMDSH